MYCRFFTLLAFFAFSSVLFAETNFEDSVFQIETINIVSEKFNTYAVGSLIHTFNNELLKLRNSESLASLLSASSAISINSYGPGGSASLMSRGGGSGHTLVTWNGLALTNSMTGSTEITNIPVSFFNSISIQQGGSSTLWGSGAVTAAIHLGDNVEIDGKSKYNISGEIGSFSMSPLTLNTRFGAFTVKNSTNRWASKTSVFVAESDNKFSYKNIYKFRSPIDTLKNAAFLNKAIIHEMALKIGEYSRLSLAFWYDNYHKDIPSQMADNNPGVAFQDDENLRMSANWTWSQKEWSIKLMSGGQINDNKYNNPAIGETGKNWASSVVNELEAKYSFNQSSMLLFGFNYTYETARSLSFNGDKIRNRLALYSLYRIDSWNSKNIFTAGIRSEEVDSEFIPLIWSLNNRYSMFKWLKVRASASYNYRLPAMNDLYWGHSAYASGNPNLTPEYGWNFECGADQSFVSNNRKVEAGQTFYYNDINNRIVWLPDNTDFWTPTNKQKSKAHGAELSLSYIESIKPLTLSINGMYSYTISKMFEKSQTGEYSSMPHIYTPKHKLSGSFKTSFLFQEKYFKELYGLYMQTYTGQRLYIENAYMPQYSISSLHIGSKLIMASYSFDCIARINNIWNEQYQVMRLFAMPGRNYSLAFVFEFQ